MPTMSARDLNRDVSAAKKAALEGPVTITHRGKPEFVLMTIADFRRMQGTKSIVDWLQMDVDIEFEPGQIDSLPRAAEL